MRAFKKSLTRLFNNINKEYFYKKPYYRLKDIYQELKREKNLFILFDEKENILGIGKVKKLDWDKKVFGFACGRIEYLIFRKDTDNLLKEFFIKEILEINKNKKFLDISIDEKDTDLRKILIKLGFKEMVKYVTYFIRLPIKFNDISIIIEPVKKNELKELERISANSFLYTRFYQDKNFKRELVKKFYQKWVRSSFNNKNHQIFVSKINNKPVGFIDCQSLKLSKKKIGIIDLIAVKKEYQGRGIGKSLVKKGLEYFQKKKIKEVYVETEKENLSALRLYKSLGMKIIGKRITFHFWYGKR